MKIFGALAWLGFVTIMFMVLFELRQKPGGSETVPGCSLILALITPLPFVVNSINNHIKKREEEKRDADKKRRLEQYEKECEERAAEAHRNSEIERAKRLAEEAKWKECFACKMTIPNGAIICPYCRSKLS